MKNFEPIFFTTADELARAVAGAWLTQWEGRHVAVPIFSFA
jgi:hypothetical protein